MVGKLWSKLKVYFMFNCEKNREIIKLNTKFINLKQVKKEC